jgi:hypothetical protein
LAYVTGEKMPVIASHAISQQSSQATGAMQQRLFRISSILLI